MCLILLVLVVEEGRVVVLLHELLRRLIDIHVGHLFSCLSCLTSLLFLSCGLFFLFGLLVRLDALELLKNVLVVEQSVREFVHKDGA